MSVSKNRRVCLRRWAYTLILFLMLFNQAAAQSITVKGRVTDMQGEPLAGISVMVQGTQKGYATDSEGYYRIEAPAEGTLVFSAIGMEELKVPVNGRSLIDVTLKEDSIMLNDLVVVGFGTQRKENLTGAVATVDVSRALENKPFTDPAKGLQGVVPGLTITFADGAITESPEINIRGMGSLNAKNGGSPLILVDNVVVNDISLVNSDDIESISVLKDAASTSIYGARAAFGVVMIKTKTGKARNKFTATYSNNFSWGTPTVLPKFPDSAVAEIEAMDKALQRANQAFDMFGMKPQPLIDGINRWIKNYSHNRKSDQMILDEDFEILDGVAYFYRLWDPVKIMYQDWTPQQNHNLRITGGSEKINFILSGAYQYQEGILKIKPEKLNKYNLNFGLNAAPAKWLDLEARFNMRQYDLKYPYEYQDPYYYMWRWGTYFPYGQYTDQNGTNAYMRHIPGFLHNASYCSFNETYSNAQVAAVVKIADLVQLRSEFAYSTTHGIRHETGGYVALWDFWAGGLTYNTRLPGSAYDETDYKTTRRTQVTSNTFATYEQLFGDHLIKVIAGLNVEKGNYNELESKKMGLMDKDKGEFPLATGTPTLDADVYDWAVAGWFGRINYSYKNKYLLELNGRYDGSSNFPFNSRWAFFPSFSAGYNISEENFFRPLREVISHMKIRGSYGTIGNQNVGADRFIPKMSTDLTNWIVGGAKVLYTGLPANVSSDLTWEKIATLNIGMDVRFF